MATRLTGKGRVTLPKKVREALQLSPGDCVEFALNGSGEIVIHKAQVVPAPSASERARLVHARVEAQRQRRAAELLALLSRLD